MKRYAEYKDSGIEWIGKIPSDWTSSKIGYYYEIQLGKMLQPEQTTKSDTFETYLCAANIKKDGVSREPQKEMWFSENDKITYRVEKGDLLVVEGGDVGLSAIYNFENPVYIQNALHRIRNRKKSSNKFLYYYLAFIKNKGYMDLVCNKATISHFTKEKLVNTPLLLPPLPTQQSIVDFLDRKTAAIDVLIADKQKLVELLREKRQAIISKAVTKGLDKNAPMKDSGVEWIGEIPEAWKMSKSKWLFTERKEKANANDIQLTASQQFGIVNQKKFMAQEGQRVVQVIKGNDILKHVEVNDFVISMRSFQGGIEWSGLQGKISSAYVMLIPNEKVYPQFFKWLLKTPSYIQALQSTSNLIRDGQALRYANFKMVDLPVIPIEEQVHIAEYINNKIAQIDFLITDITFQIKNLKEYRQAIISEAVTGKVAI